MQKKFEEASEVASATVVEGSSGAGMVRVRANGKGEIIAIEIESALIDKGDGEMIQDLVRVAANDALSKAKDSMKDEIQKITGGMSLPPGMSF